MITLHSHRSHVGPPQGPGQYSADGRHWFDEASGQWYLFGIHVPSGERPGEHADIGGRYRFRARRTGEGWRFAEVLLDVLWNAGTTFTVEQHAGA